MLQWLRDNLKSFAWTLWLVIIAFILFYIPDLLGGGGPGPTTVATIAGESVGLTELRRQASRLERQYREAFGQRLTPEMLERLQLRRQALDQLVAQKMMLSEARRLGLEVSDRELRRAILDAGFTDESGRFIGDERYANAVSRLGFESVAEFEEAMRDELLVTRLQDVLEANLYLSDAEVEQSYRQEVERARVRYLELPATRFAGEAAVGPEELAAYYEARREEYRQPEKRVVSYLLVDRFRLRPQIEIPDEEIRAYYRAHPDEFTVEEQVRARHILLRVDDRRGDEEAREQLAAARARIEGGEDFAAVAREISEDPGSKDRGGDLGFFGRGQMVPEFEEAAFSGQPGELVGPVRSAHGYHLIEVLDRRQGGQRPFEEVEGQIRYRLQGERAAEVAERRIRELASRIESEGLSAAEDGGALDWGALAEGADEVSFATTDPFGEQEAVPGLGRAPEFNQAAFTLEPGAVSDPINVPRGWAVLRLDSVQEPRVPPLSEVETQVRQALSRQKQQDLAVERLSAVREAIRDGGTTLEAAAAELGVELTESEPFGHGQPVPGLAAGAAVAESALSMAEGELGGPMATPQGAVLFEVTERTAWDPAEFAAQEESIRARLRQQEMQRLLGAFIQEWRNRGDFKLNPPLLESMGIIEPGAES